MRVGVISDTHGYVSPKVFDAFEGVEKILHAGDVGPYDVIIELSAIAPVTAVRGNMDQSDITSRYPEDQRFQMAGVDIFMTHNGAYLLRNQPQFQARCSSKRPEVFIWGHTHRPECKMINGMLSLNPGSAKPMIDLPSSVAILLLEPKKEPRAEIIMLDS